MTARLNSLAEAPLAQAFSDSGTPKSTVVDGDLRRTLLALHAEVAISCISDALLISKSKEHLLPFVAWMLLRA